MTGQCPTCGSPLAEGDCIICKYGLADTVATTQTVLHAAGDEIRAGLSTGSEGQSENAVGVIENIVYRPNAQQIALGDIFLEPSKATYIAYGLGLSFAPIAYGAAAALGGLMLMASLPDIKPDELMHHAKADRLKHWGWTPDERAAVKGIKVVIRRDDIKSFETSGGLAIRTDDKQIVFGYAYPKEAVQSAALFEEWQRGKLKSHPSIRRFGLDRGFNLTPQRLIRAVLTKAPIEPGLLETVISNDEYMKSLWEGVEATGPQQRRRLLIAWRRESDAFRAQVIQFLQDKASTGDRIPRSVFVLGIVTLMAIGLNIGVDMSENAHAFLGMMTILPLGGFIGKLADWRRGPRWYYGQLIDFEREN